MAFKMPRFEMTSDFKVWLTALISDSAVDVDTLPIRLAVLAILEMVFQELYVSWSEIVTVP